MGEREVKGGDGKGGMGARCENKGNEGREEVMGVMGRGIQVKGEG